MVVNDREYTKHYLSTEALAKVGYAESQRVLSKIGAGKQPIPSTMKPGARHETHVPLPTGYFN